jgi:hypothetical protein
MGRNRFDEHRAKRRVSFCVLPCCSLLEEIVDLPGLRGRPPDSLLGEHGLELLIPSAGVLLRFPDFDDAPTAVTTFAGDMDDSAPGHVVL